MGGELPTLPTDPHEPTVAEWSKFMQDFANTGTADAIVSMALWVVEKDAEGKEIARPVSPDYKIPGGWVKVSPRFAVTPPVVPGPTNAAWKPATVTSAVNFRAAGEKAGRAIGVLSPSDVGTVIWLFDGVTRVSDGLTWQFVKVVTPSLTDYGWIAADYLRIQEKSG